MSLESLLSMQGISSEGERTLVTQDRLKQQLPHLRKRIAFWREYPDLFVDENKGAKSTFKFYTYQRVFIRIVMRHRYVYATFPRAYSKSFLSMMVLMIRCVLFPFSHLFVTTGGKEPDCELGVTVK